MIIRCPECSTGFELPDDRVTEEGTKLKCSKCEHVFRVRDDDGESEIFYKDGDRERGDDDEPDEADESSPFPHAGMDLEPKKESAFGDLDADEDEMAAFHSAFDEDEGDQDDEADEDFGDGPADFVETNSPPGAGSAGSSSGGDPSGGGAAVAVDEQQDEAEQEEAVLGAGTDSTFGDPADHVDDSFGEDGAYFDPDEGKKVDDSKPAADSGGDGGGGDEPSNRPPSGGGSGGPSPAGPPNTGQGPPPGAAGPPTQSGGPPGGGPSTPDNGGGAGNQPGGGPAQPAAAQPATESTTASDSWDDQDLEPHNIGGSTGQKVVTSLLLLSLVVIGFAGVVAYLNDGFIDFQAPGEMIESAFGDGEYEPRDEWTSRGTETQVVEPSEPVEVEGVHAQLVDLGAGDEVFVIQGMVRNHDDSRVHGIDLRASLMTPEERTMQEIRRMMGGGDVSIGEIREQRSAEDVDELVSGTDVVLESGEVESFTMVFDQLPQRVSDGEHFTYQVEIADKEEG